MAALTRVAVIINPLSSYFKDLADALHETLRSRGLRLVRVEARGAGSRRVSFPETSLEGILRGKALG